MDKKSISRLLALILAVAVLFTVFEQFDGTLTTTQSGVSYTQFMADAKAGKPARAGGVPDKLPDDAPWFVKDYFDYYKTERGYHPRSLNSNAGWNVTSSISFAMENLLGRPDEIRSAVMLVHGEKAHSCYFSKDVFPKLKGDNKRLLLVPGAVHTDLYDKKDVIPFDEIEKFYRTHLV